MRRRPTVFISYSRQDRAYVSKLAAWLEGHGVGVWYDHDIDFGAKWESEIKAHLDAASVVIAVMSSAARRASWVDRELARAQEQRIEILPLLLDRDGIVERVAELQFDNVVGGRMPTLEYCQHLPGFLVSERDLLSALTPKQAAIARRVWDATGALGPGFEGPAVAALQVELHRVGLNPGPIDGVCGDRTASTIREFQQQRCDEPNPDGFVGPYTWAILVNSSLGDLDPDR